MLIYGGDEESDYIGGTELKRKERTEVVDDRVIIFLKQIEIRRQQDKDYLPFDLPHRSFIKNLTLSILRESKAIHLLNELELEEPYHCPRRLYYLLQDEYKDLPMFPTYIPTIAYNDAGIYKVIDSIKDMCINIEKYYTVVYDFLQQKINKN